MKQQFILFKRKGVYYSKDTTTRKQRSLLTKDEAEALTLLHSKNEAARQPILNLQIARTYMAASDLEVTKRTWQVAMDEITITKKGSTRTRYERAMKDKAFDIIRNTPILETHSSQFLKVLAAGTVATNVFLRRIHNFALDINWLAWPLLNKKQWPSVCYKDKRAITLKEHQAVIERERNPELHGLYSLLWYVGGSQTDTATLTAEDVDWNQRVISYSRGKSGSPALLRFGKEVETILRTLPASGPLFPKISKWHEKHRAKEFKRRCVGLGIEGVTLHSYRYSWAERVRVAGYPERFAQEALGHNSKAVHRAYARRVKASNEKLEQRNGGEILEAEVVTETLPVRRGQV